ncbi:prevent-host-death protein [Rhodoplanes elegans]|uniref:Antitoxin n=1 Tax=Rhodoplanes elegans TaxID=29408 RepID=A0A327K718_9BRAD|nr:type II toxin-antitoxin system Phd/YefM family antitoxin [Rhodoplanes elegans]MBK5961534.1 prevent-host-death protein [Rhodoplanes elegans]RAI33465.1 prevent-host-death protein [Rhodoplanes elegans]
MIRVSSKDFGREVERYEDVALREPVVVTRDGRDRTVMISADEYRRLKRRDREVLGVEDFSDADAEAVRLAAPAADAAAFDHEVET